MGVRDQLRRAYYGTALPNDIITTLPIFSGASFLNTATTAAATGNYATAIGVVVGNNYDLQGRSTKAYILEKHYIGNRTFSSFWYFGRCQDPTGRIIGGTQNLSPYPLRAYCDNGNGYYGSLPLGVQGLQGKAVITSARMDFRKSSASAGSAGVASGAQGVLRSNTNTAETTGIASAAAGLKMSLSAGVIATNAVQTAVEATTGTGAASITDGALSNLILWTAVGTLSSGAQNFAGTTTLNTLITDSTGQTASTTFAALTGTVTSTVAGAALAQLAANENKRLGLFGAVIAGTSAVQGLFLNLGSTTTGDGDNGTDNVVEGELLLNGVVEISGTLIGDI